MEKRNELGILISIETPARRLERGWFPPLAALLVYAAIWSAALDMAGLAEALPLAVGLVLTAPLVLASPKSYWVLSALCAGTLLCSAIFWDGLLDGWRLLVNQFFAASQRRQAYIYQMLPVSTGEAEWAGCIRKALLFGGIASAPLCAAIGRGRRWLAVAVLPLAAAAEAYLGVSPSLWRGIGLPAALGLAMLEPSEDNRRILSKAALLLALTFGIAAGANTWGGENPRLSAWEESVRDQIALQTTAYTEHWEPELTQPPPPMEPEDAFYREEEALSDTGGDMGVWAQRLPFLLLVLAVLLVLFVPSILADMHRNRIARNRRGLEDPDNGAAIRAMFLYSFSWLRLGGLRMRNVPYSAYAGELEGMFPADYAGRFRQALPLWQEAAYSGHAMTAEQRERMRCFMEETREAVLTGMSRRERLAAKYIHALE